MFEFPRSRAASRVAPGPEEGRGGAAGEDPVAPVAAKSAGERFAPVFERIRGARHRRRDDPGAAVLALFALGVVVVATSATSAPTILYKDGLNLRVVLPFVALVKAPTVPLAPARRPAPIIAWRSRRARRSLLPPPARQSDAAIDAAFCVYRRRRGAPLDVPRLGRRSHVPQASDAVARFDFDALCRNRCRPADYLELVAISIRFGRPDSVLTPGSATRGEAIHQFHRRAYDMRGETARLGGRGAEALARRRRGREAFEFARTPRDSSRCARTIWPCPWGEARGCRRGPRRHRGDLHMRALRCRPRATSSGSLRSPMRMCASCDARTTVVGVAVEAGMTHANVYRYFPSKTALLDEVVAASLRPLEARLREAADGADPAHDKLERMLMAVHRDYRGKLDADRRCSICSSGAGEEPSERAQASRAGAIRDPARGRGRGRLRLVLHDRPPPRHVAHLRRWPSFPPSRLASARPGDASDFSVASRFEAVLAMTLRALRTGRV